MQCVFCPRPPGRSRAWSTSRRRRVKGERPEARPVFQDIGAVWLTDLEELLAHRTSHTVKAEPRARLASSEPGHVAAAASSSASRPAPQWERLGAAATALGEAITAADHAAIAAALDELGDAVHALGHTLADER